MDDLKQFLRRCAERNFTVNLNELARELAESRITTEELEAARSEVAPAFQALIDEGVFVRFPMKDPPGDPFYVLQSAVGPIIEPS